MLESAGPLVSVVVPCYNGERYLAAALDSILGQSYPHIEVIVVNDGSTDGSADVLSGYGDRIHCVYRSNSGVSATRNAGIKLAQGEYLAFLDADDWWSANFVSKMASALTQNCADLAYCGWQNIGLQDRQGQPFIPPDYALGDPIEVFLPDCRWPVHGAMARTELVRSVGGFDEALTLGEDFDLWLRIAPFHRVIRVPEVLAFYRFHEGPQATKNREKTITNRWRIQQKFLNLHPQSVRHMTRSHVRELTHGDLMRRGFDCYWQEDLDTARRVFRLVMRTGYGSASDWLYMLPSLMPMSWHRRLLARMRSRKSRNSVEPK